MPATYTYDIALTADKDKIRALIRDVDSNDWILANEEITFYASLAGGGIYNQAAACADAAAAELGRQLSVKDTIDSREQYDMMLSRAKSLRERDSTTGVAPYAGGISVAEKAASDSDRVSPAFRKDLFDYAAESWSQD